MDRYSLAGPLFVGIGKAIQSAGAQAAPDRTDVDISLSKTALGVAIAAAATFLLYYYFAGSLAGVFLLTGVTIVLAQVPQLEEG